MKKSKKIVKSLKMLIVDQNGNGQGLNTVKTEDVTYSKVRKIIGSNLEFMPVKLVYKGKMKLVCLTGGKNGLCLLLLVCLVLSLIMLMII